MRWASCVEDRDEFVADDLALGLRIGHAGELVQETIGGIDRDQVQAQLVAQALLHFFELVLAQHAVVDEHASEARNTLVVAHGAIHQGGGHGGIDAAGEGADGASLAHGLAHAGDGGIDEVLRRPGGLGRRRCPRAKLRRMSVPDWVWRTSGWNCTAHIFRSGASMAATALGELATR